MSIQSTNVDQNVDQKSLETEFSIVICRPTGDKWQSKTLFLSIFDPRFFDCEERFRLPPTRCEPFILCRYFEPRHVISNNVEF